VRISSGRAGGHPKYQKIKRKKNSGEEKELREKATTEDVNLISHAGATFAFPQLVSQ
jgi:hypothetical protein